MPKPKPKQNPLAANDDGSDEIQYLFHTTSYVAVESIAEHGLLPRTGSGVFQHGGYDIHSRGKIFATEGGGALEWFGKVQDMLHDHDSEHGDFDERVASVVPVMLRIDLDAFAEEPKEDEVGSADVIGGASVYFTQPIPSEALDFWHPKKHAWLSLDEHDLPDAILGVEQVEFYDEEGDPVSEEEWEAEGSESAPGIETFDAYEVGGFKPPLPVD